MAASDRAALIDFYNATDGDNWTDNTNWCTDAPLDEWYGITTNDIGRVIELRFIVNNATGSIPESIGDLTNLQVLELFDSGITGVIPESIGNLRNLYQLCITCDNLTGSLPESIANLTNLTLLSIACNNLTGSIPDSYRKLVNLRNFGISGSIEYEWNLGYDFGIGQISGEIPDIFGDMYQLSTIYMPNLQLTGAVPSSIGELKNLSYLNLGCNQLEGSIDFLTNLTNLTSLKIYYNNFSGIIPEEFANRSDWSEIAWGIIPTQRDGYGFTSFPDVYLEPSNLVTIDGVAFNTENLFKENKLTCVVYWASWCAFSEIYIEALKDLYNSYASKGFGLIALSEDDLDTITSYTTSNNIPGHICQLTERFDDYSDGTNRVKYLPTYMLGTPAYAIVDSEGKIVFSESIYEFDDPTTCRVETTIAFMEEYFGEPMGESEEEDDTDYSKDGEVITLQTATQGSGIDLVIVGDGFIDTDMESGGVYETRMKEAMEHFFSEEPYTTYRDRFNVYTVKAVSEQSGVNGVNDTAFSSWFGDGTLIGGDDTKVFEYAMKVPSINSTDDLTVITVLNSSAYAGTCYMYTNGASVGYCPIVSYNDEQFRQIIVHEVGGHGFAKLLDEYAYEGTIPDEEIEAFKTQKSWGWGANVDVTDDEDEIQWAHLLADYRYSGLVDIYEGALTYAYGAYRPTDVSIMRYNTGGFNPPSREAIYKHIMELSGSTYSYENFVSYDAINRSVSSQAYSAKQALSVSKSTFVPLANPVVISGSPQISK